MPIYWETLDQYMTHDGIDLAAPAGTSVKTCASGTVTRIEKDDRYGMIVEISHGNDLLSLYGNLAEDDLVELGEVVSRGDVIGKVGKNFAAGMSGGVAYVLDENNDNDLNRYTPDQLRDIPFTNMIYIGDGLTDVPCMKLVTVNGGKSIAVYGKDSEKKKAAAQQLVEDHRADFIAPADYSENRELDKIVKSILDYTEARIQMERLMRKEQSNKK